VERDNIVVDGAGYTLQGTGSEIGIYLLFRSNVTIRDVTIRAFYLGIYMTDSSNSTISGNTVANNYDEGIYLSSSSNNTISGNNITNNRFGIYLNKAPNNSVSGNNITSSYHGIELEESSKCSIYENNITNKGSMHTCTKGIAVGDSSNNNSILGNTITASSWSGILLGFSYNNTISGNNITNSGWGVELWASSNRIYHNNFIDNAEQVHVHFLGSANFWDDGFPSGGNYWSDYTGVDSDYDGIGDSPYVIDPHNKDNYPLMGMFSDFPITYEEEIYDVTTICNSTISGFHFDHANKIIDFDVTGSDGTVGFCRIMIPTILIESPYTVLVDGEEISYTELPISNITHAFLYFTYIHSIHHIRITGPPPVGGKATPINIPMNKPETPTLWIWLTTITFLLITTVVYVKKRKKNT